MSHASTWKPMSPELQRVAERARREPKGTFHSLAHLITEEVLEQSYRRIRNSGAVGVDGVTKEQYGRNLKENLRDLHERMKTKRYRHQSLRRVHIPKEKGKTRPIGISAFEDKIVQDALREVLQAVYEQDFLDSSYGFRPGRSTHDALRALNRSVYRGEVNVILEADIENFFSSLDRTQLKEMLQERVMDGSLMRLIGKCLHVGILDGVEFSRPERGVAQGSVLSPLLGNVYLHYVLDEWFETVVRPRLAGKAVLVRYCDDFVVGFELESDARRVMRVIHKRMHKYGLRLHPDKTRVVPFRRPPKEQQRGKGPGTFDFLGFTLYWRRTRRGRWEMAFKTRHARLTRFLQTVYRWCRRHRHRSVKDQHDALTRRIRGHFNYYGVNGNLSSMAVVVRQTQRIWHKWLCRRSNRSRLTWERFQDLLRDFPLPTPRIVVQVWGR